MDDLISRQAAIDAVSAACWELRGVFERCEEALKALPSARPEQKKGKWIDTRDYCGEFMCSNCHETNINNFYKYCPYCGAEMKEGVYNG